MSQDKLFVIGIGGTGMRCLEAFTHLCAIGMFDNQEIEVLTLDTDQLNGNKTKTENLIELYSRIKTSDSGPKGGTPNANTFFSAKLNGLQKKDCQSYYHQNLIHLYFLILNSLIDSFNFPLHLIQIKFFSTSCVVI